MALSQGDPDAREIHVLHGCRCLVSLYISPYTTAQAPMSLLGHERHVYILVVWSRARVDPRCIHRSSTLSHTPEG